MSRHFDAPQKMKIFAKKISGIFSNLRVWFLSSLIKRLLCRLLALVKTVHVSAEKRGVMQ